MSLPLAARAFLGVVVAVGLAVLALRAPEIAAWDAGDAGTVVALTLAIAVADQFTIGLPHGDETEYFSLTDAVWVAGLLLAPGSVLVVAVALGALIGQSLRGWALHKVAFNVGQVVLAVSAAEAVYSRLGPQSPTELEAWAVAGLAMALCFVINAATVALVISLASGQRFLEILFLPRRVNVLHWVGNVAVGVLGALVWTANPVGVVLLAVPLAFLYAAYRGWLQTLRERDQMARMGMTADTIAKERDMDKRLPEPGGSDPVSHLAATLNRMLERLQQAFDRERRFIREASHELRTPITVSRGHLEVLGRDADPSEVRQAIDVVLDELERMTRLVEDLTTLAGAAGPELLRRERIELAPFLGELATKAVPLLDGRLRTQPPPPDAVLVGDPQRLTQAILNLLHNAAVHARPGSRVELRVREEPGAWRFEVADEGGGLRPGEEDGLFRPFHRGSTAGEGSGLGLAIVRTIAEAHGGSAGIENRPGAGVTVWLSVPR